MSKRFILFFLLSWLVVVSALAQRKWVVSDQDLTVWDSPNYLNKLGMVHRGYEITEIGLDGDMIRFEFEGQTAYVATYCCKLKEQKAEKASEAVKSVEAKEVKKNGGESVRQNITETVQEENAGVEDVCDRTEETEVTHPDKRAENNSFSSVVFNSLSSFMGPWFFLCLLLVVLFAFFHVDVPGIFDKMAGMDVADIGAKCFRPLIAFTICGVAYYYSSDWDIALGALLVYEVILLILRTKQLDSFRAAVVEMLYLTMVASVFVLIIIPMLFFMSGGSSGSKRKSGNDDDTVLINDEYGRIVRARRTGGTTFKGDDGHEYEKDGCGNFEKKTYD